MSHSSSVVVSLVTDFLRPSQAPRPAATNATPTMAPTMVLPLCEDAGATGIGVGVNVGVRVGCSVDMDVGMPKVAVLAGRGVLVTGMTWLINSFWPMKMSSEER